MSYSSKKVHAVNKEKENEMSWLLKYNVHPFPASPNSSSLAWSPLLWACWICPVWRPKRPSPPTLSHQNSPPPYRCSRLSSGYVRISSTALMCLHSSITTRAPAMPSVPSKITVSNPALSSIWLEAEILKATPLNKINCFRRHHPLDGVTFYPPSVT